MKCKYECAKGLYDQYYLDQSGSGLPVYVGNRYIRGSGLGSIFSGLLRSAVPLLKAGGKHLLKEGAKAGLQVVGDVMEGRNIKDSLKTRAKATGKQLFQQAVGGVKRNILPPGRSHKRIKQSRAGKPRHKKRRIQPRDIFD